ncbi:MAG: pyridoxamine 5'-phosphate oxidase family protein [Treponema sp.]|jgi:nitroimidazol reductase NimA-like FMN-containing flavoprotein (pyridoxamine 5'-phosphate oxidase superfamily)|nr:pyridoxamine 5'-phosphate oxidase family protein [Treponema sp.]
MHHADREIRDRKIIMAILDMCDVINIGFFDDEYPYVLPVNFGYEFEDNLVFYTHHAAEGYKNKLIKSSPKVCVVTHKFIDHIHNDYDNSGHDYRSVMAFGEMSVIERESAEYGKAWGALCRCNGRAVPDAVFKPEFKVLMSKIACRPENVIGKAQRHITTVDQVPFNQA